MNGLTQPSVLDRPGMGQIIGGWAEESLVTFSASTTQAAKPSIVESCPDTLKAFVGLHQFEVDNQPFSFNERDYLLPIYEAIRYDRGDHFSMVLMTGAQVAKSVTAMLSLTMAAVKFWGRSFGYFLPDQEMSMIFSSMRYMPLLESCLGLKPLIGQDQGGIKKEDRKRVRSIGRSTIYFSYMGGKTSTEALPMRWER